MRYVDRSSVSVPSYFSSASVQSARNEMLSFLRLSPARMSQSRAPIFGGAMDDPSVREQLLKLFRGKCSFCEQRKKELRCYRFRPPADAQPPVGHSSVAHVYYAWLADAWQNLYLICPECLPAQTDYFPVAKERAPIPTGTATDPNNWPPGYPPKESPLLLDPCRDKSLVQHLEFGIDGLVLAKTRRGAETIETFRLNRNELHVRRNKVFELRFQALKELVRRGRNGFPAQHEVFDFGAPPFAGGWMLFLLALSERISGSILRDTSQLSAFFGRLARRKDARDVLGRAVERFDHDRDRRASPAARKQVRAQKGTSFRSASVRNFKGLENLSLKMPGVASATGASTILAEKTEQPVPSLLILGENAAGKSSILEALALALIDDQMRHRLNLDPKRNILDPTYMGARKEASDRKVTVDIRFDDKSTRTLKIGKDGFRSNGNRSLPPVFAYGAFRHFLDNNSERRPETAVITIFKPESVLANPEEWLLGLDEERFHDVIRALRSILSIESDFEVIERDQKKRRCLIVQKTAETGKFVRYPLRAVSSGYRAVLAMACDIFRGLMERKGGSGNVSLRTAQAIVLIDEVESHLHPRWKMQIMRGLREALPKVTFIATTHDPLCLRGMQDGEVMVLQRIAVDNRRDGKTLPVMVEALTPLRDVSKLTIEQLLTSDLFSLYTTDKPELEIHLARIADILAKDQKELEPAERAALKAFNADIQGSLPVGNTQVHRLVQAAVADYLRVRRRTTAANLKRLERETKKRILDALMEA